MANHTFLTFLCLLLLSTLSSAADVTRDACNASRDPPTCVALLSSHAPPNATLSQVIQTALTVTTLNLNKGRTLINRVLSDSTKNQNWSDAALTCLDSVRYSEYRVNLVGPAVATRHTLKDARAWMSAALVYQDSCCSRLKYVQVNQTKSGADAIDFFNSTLIPGTSSTLAMIRSLDVFGPETRYWGPPKTERDGFWEPFSRASGSRPAAGVPAGLKADATVCKSGCKYKTVQAAVNATPDNLGPGKRFVIRIKTGVYQETVRVPLEKKNVVFVGDGIGKTVINGSNSVGLNPGMTTYNSATVGVVGDVFMARDLTIQNTAGANAHQAVAFRSDSDGSVLENCEFLGNQDTLYAVSLRQYYKSCHIQGNVDFIFGNSAAVFQDCTILISPRLVEPEKGEKNTVTAHGRTDPGQPTGFVFKNSVISGTKAYLDLYRKNPKVHLNYLGRPWKEYSRTVFIECTLEGLISAEGWTPWDGEFALGTAYYAEFKNKGAGSNPSKRANWSSLIPPGHVEAYSPQNFIQAF